MKTPKRRFLLRSYKLNLLALVVLSAAVPGAHAAAAQSDADVVKSFKNYVAGYMVSYKTDRREYVGNLGGGWAKIYFEPSGDSSIDVRKTDSLVSPYMGVLEFTLIKHFTAFHKTRAEAEADNSFTQSTEARHRHTYASQDGTWVPKSRQNYVAILNEWSDCEQPSDGCLEEDAK